MSTVKSNPLLETVGQILSWLWIAVAAQVAMEVRWFMLLEWLAWPQTWGFKNETNEVREIHLSYSINNISRVTSGINSALWMEAHKREISTTGSPWGSLSVEFHLWLEIYFNSTEQAMKPFANRACLEIWVILKTSTAKLFFLCQVLFPWWQL